MLNSLVQQQKYSRLATGKIHWGKIIFLIIFVGIFFLALQGFFIILQQHTPNHLLQEDLETVAELMGNDISFLPGATYRKEDLPIAHYFEAGNLLLAWASPQAFASESFSGGNENSSGMESNHSLPVVPPVEKVSAEDILAASGKLKDMAPIGIYCTHTTESYIPTYGEAKANGERGGIYEVALALKESLAQKGIPAIVSDTIHDYPEWEKSYSNSLQTMEEMKKKYPEMEMFIDVHRDALGSDDPLITEINGEEVTKLMLVVGSNKRSNHPNWEENLAFARKIGNALEADYPGILRSVRVQSGRYNQHMSPKSILVEVGCSNSSLEQAKKGVDYLAAAIEKVLLAEQLAKEKPTKTEKETENQKGIKENQSKNSDSGLLNGTEAMEMVPIVE